MLSALTHSDSQCNYPKAKPLIDPIILLKQTSFKSYNDKNSFQRHLIALDPSFQTKKLKVSDPILSNPPSFGTGTYNAKPSPSLTEAKMNKSLSLEEMRIQDYNKMKVTTSLKCPKEKNIIERLNITAMKMSLEEVRAQDYLSMKALKTNINKNYRMRSSVKPQEADGIYDPMALLMKEQQSMKIEVEVVEEPKEILSRGIGQSSLDSKIQDINRKLLNMMTFQPCKRRVCSTMECENEVI